MENARKILSFCIKPIHYFHHHHHPLRRPRRQKCANNKIPTKFSKGSPDITPHSFPFDMNESNEINILHKTTSCTHHHRHRHHHRHSRRNHQTMHLRSYIHTSAFVWIRVCVYVDVTQTQTQIQFSKFKSTFPRC